ncbi:ATP-dependent Clp protease ATP-binding subunit [Lactobacillus sp. Sy-1]|uniref:ATP-dependent Clp protease ATP-binding subunit n=1 Tax=Lactobacillus sp. Sy-1 TaxID=2109645 RepID=UPI001C58855E|nr:ATP-dependent Clp protease ATP-binding subunit [Lactobacillus sp. Sy-1]MBW1605388.1 AAA family ATPase [Lactobacillus sp. Sy-1]
MLCQNCSKNEATIHLYVSQNGYRQRIDLCQNCYQLLQNNGNGGANMAQDPFGFGDLNDIFRSMQNGNQGNQSQNQSQPQSPKVAKGGNNSNTVLGKYGINMTQLAKDGKIDPVIGRDKEIKRVIEILNRRTKNNPVLIGEAGVGKTAVVEGLALEIAAGNVPVKLRDKQVIRLDVVSLVQGTGVRGQFEERMQSLVKEVQANPNIILFIDEIHEIMGAGNAEGGMDAGNVLKPALARGEFQLIGATTLNEYRNIEKDAALARRFQTVMVQEPEPKEAVKILKGIQGKYESYHQVKYSAEAIKAAVKLSDRYIQGRFLPDKAIDLIDEAGSRKNLTIDVVDPAEIERKIKAAKEQKEIASKEEDYEKAAYYRDQINKLQDAKDKNNVTNEKTPEVNVRDIQKIVEEITNIPVGDLQTKEQQQLKNLGADLKAKIIGQDSAVDTVAKAIKRNRVGFNGTGRPIGSFLFVGTTGVGKTELAKQLANELFGSEDAMIRFDMSEYREPHSISKLIGSPPGYVGYDEAGQLTEKVRRNPYSLILFDEIEKANPDVLHAFLQILDDGRLTDSQGRTISFKDTVIIMTSNAGTGKVEASVGFGASAAGKSHSALNHLGDYFKPEFLNRFDDIVEFNSLSKASLKQIVTLMFANMNKMLSQQGVHVDISDGVVDRIVELGYNPAMGARPLRRLIQETVEDQVADFYLDHQDVRALTATIDDKNEITVKQASK